MSQETVMDQRANVGFDIQEGMVFEDTRYDDPVEYEVVYANRDHKVLFVDEEGDDRRDEIYLVEPYEQFERHVGSGRYRPLRDDEGDVVRRGRMGQVYRLKEQYDEQDGRTATHKAEAIEEVLSILEDDVPDDHNDEVPFEAIDGIGSKAATSLRAAGYTTKGDVRNASREQLMDVSHMGAKNTDNLLEWVDQ